MVYSDYTKLRILFYHFKGYRAPTIARLLEAENICLKAMSKFGYLKIVYRCGRMGIYIWYMYLHFFAS